MKVYFDACCLSRPFDDLSVVRNRLEAEAFLLLIKIVKKGELTFIGSEVLQLELSKIVSGEKRKKAGSFLSYANSIIEVNDRIEEDAREIERLGFKPLDAFHIACARAAGADVLLTTDDQFVNRGKTKRAELGILIENPLIWIRTYEEAEL